MCLHRAFSGAPDASNAEWIDLVRGHECLGTGMVQRLPAALQATTSGDDAAFFSIHNELAVMRCIYNKGAVFDWDENNLRKIRAHRIKPEEVEQGLANSPIPIYEQDVQGNCATYTTAKQIRGGCWPLSWWSAASRSGS